MREKCTQLRDHYFNVYPPGVDYGVGSVRRIKNISWRDTILQGSGVVECTMCNKQSFFFMLCGMFMDLWEWK